MSTVPLGLGVQRIYSEGSEFGVTLTAHASNNTKASSYTDLTSALPYACQGFMLAITRLSSTNSRDMLIDIAIGSAASEQIIVPNILVSMDANNISFSVYIPVALPQGVRVSARCQSSDGGQAIGVRFSAFAGTHLLMQGLPREGVNYGANTADSGGVSVDPGGSISAKGNYSELTAATTRAHAGLLVCFGYQNNAAAATRDLTCDIAIGAAASEQIIIPDLGVASLANEALTPGLYFIPISVPAGSRLAARGRTNTTDATDRLFDVVIIGF